MNTLIDVEIDEISLVDTPANPGAAILLFKRDASTAVTRARLALEAVKKALGATIAGKSADDMPTTVAGLDEAFKALVRRMNNDPAKAFDSPEGKAIYQRRYEIENRLDRVEKQTEPEWKQEVAALDSVKQADRFLAALVAQQVARTGRPRNEVYSALLKQPIGVAIYQRRAELARAA